MRKICYNAPMRSVAVLALAILVGCGENTPPTPSELEIRHRVAFHKESDLAGCVYYKVVLHSTSPTKTLYLVRCPLSSTEVSYNCGKGCTAHVNTTSETKPLTLEERVKLLEEKTK